MNDDLIALLDAAPTALETARELERRFIDHGFVRLDESERWRIEPGGRYLVGRGAALIAWVMGSVPISESGARVAVAHVDSPCLKVKHRALRVDGDYVIAPVEVYGSPIIASWVDRDLSMAGSLVVGDEGENAFGAEHSVVPFRFSQPCGVIPNLAVHLNRKMNESLRYNEHEHLNVLLDLAAGASSESATDGENNQSSGARLVAAAAASVNVDPSQVLDAEFFLCDSRAATLTGLSGSLVSAAAIDNRAGCFSVQNALCSNAPSTTSVAVFYDHEEVGSRSTTGADSVLLRDWLGRIIWLQHGQVDGEAFYRAVSRSTVISNDAAHAVHPSYRDRHDRAFAPVLGGGPVLKVDANQRYAGSSELAARIRVLARRSGCRLQELISRADMRPGSTVGPFTAAQTGMATVDIGIPILAMHSIRETAGVTDFHEMCRLLTAYFHD